MRGNKFVPIYQWTNGGDRVLLVKCTTPEGTSFGGFKYPTTVGAQVKPEYCSKKPDCESGGLFGWAWGLNLGGGKTSDYSGLWFVLSAPPEQIISIGNKQKIADDSPDLVDCRVEFCGSWHEAMEFTREGRMAWIEQNSEYKITNTRDYASIINKDDKVSVSNTGDSGSVTNRGVYSLANNTGRFGSTNNSGDRGLANNTGENGSASNTGDYGVASNTNDTGMANNSGRQGLACNTGSSGAANNLGVRGSASSTHCYGAAHNTGFHGSAINTGFRGLASSTGERSLAGCTDNFSTVSNHGIDGIAALTGEGGTIEVGPNSFGVVTATTFSWIVRRGAVLAIRWQNEAGKYHQKLLVANKLKLRNGRLVNIERGKIIRKKK